MEKYREEKLNDKENEIAISYVIHKI